MSRFGGLSGSEGRRRLIGLLDTPADLVDRKLRPSSTRTSFGATDVSARRRLLTVQWVGGQRLVLVAAGTLELRAARIVQNGGFRRQAALMTTERSKYRGMVRVRRARTVTRT